MKRRYLTQRDAERGRLAMKRADKPGLDGLHAYRCPYHGKEVVWHLGHTLK